MGTVHTDSKSMCAGATICTKMGTVPTRFESFMNSAVTNIVSKSLDAESLCGLSPFLYYSIGVPTA